jgi:hypothetical protein
MKGRSPTFTQLPLDIVGSTKFGRYSKISVEQTYNMIISDGFLVPSAGYKLVTAIQDSSAGRDIYTSNRDQKMFAVIGNGLYSISSNLTQTRLQNLSTYQGDVFISENNGNQLAICDKQNLYIYNYVTGAFEIATLPPGVIPGYVTFQNGYFIIVDVETAGWYLSAPNNGLSWLWGAGGTPVAGSLQTKPDKAIAAIRFPGRGNLLLVFGNTVTELNTDVGSQIFPYQRASQVNIDYGCLNAATIAGNENIVVWLGGNEQSGPVIMYTTGADVNRISTDGIDFKFTQLKNPSNSYGFLFRQDGHLLYQLTFPEDNLTYVYDFNTKKFFTFSDQYLNAHIAKKVAFFNDAYYFVSNVDGNVYQLGTQFTTYDGKEIPRIRICRNIRLPDASRFVVNNLTFTLEQGVQEDVALEDDLLTESGLALLTETGEPLQVMEETTEIIEVPLYSEEGELLFTEDGEELLGTEEAAFSFSIPQKVALSVSKDGGQSFGTVWSKELNASGHRKNRLIYWNLGSANDFVPQFRFWGLGRFVATDGIVSMYQ